MALRMYTTMDAFSQLQPRHASRRERKPGLRERHATQRERFSPEPYRKTVSNSKPQTPRSTSYCHVTGAAYNQPVEKHAVVEPEIRVSAYKELSTIEDIRADMRATASRQPERVKSRVPDWLLNLDINLDVTSVDIIPPFQNEALDSREKFTEKSSVTLVCDDYDDDYEYDSDDDIVLDKPKTGEGIESQTTERTHGQQNNPPMSETFTKSRGNSPPLRNRSPLSGRSGRHTPTGNYVSDSYSPRRYQGDKRVMSMQQGGIRSTPMQPKSKKYINQMITYRHMKIHDKKLQKAKAAVDTKMPSTFHIALDRKRLLETRLSSSFDSTRESTKSRSSQNESSRSKSQNSQR